MQAVYEQLIHKIGQKVTLIAVSKGQPVSKIVELYKLGHRDFGENYVQELTEKFKECEALGLKGIRWHFLGALQRNKVKSLLPLIHTLHSLDRIELAAELDKEIKKSDSNRKLRAFVQINIDDEESKSGVRPDEAGDFVKSVQGYSSLMIEGLMCIPDPSHTKDGKAFQKLKSLSQTLSTKGSTLHSLSMGMSDDYEVAIQNGATHIRIGTLLFGARS